MSNQHEVYYTAMKSRDARFDGRFFIGVHTTGIYCRPICPAPNPKRANITFYPTAAAAKKAGYWPCLRCRPESSPGTPEWDAGSAPNDLSAATNFTMRSSIASFDVCMEVVGCLQVE